MKKIYALSLATTLSFLLIQPVLADSTILAPKIICGNISSQFLYASNNLSIELKSDADQHPDSHSFPSTSLIIPLITEKKDAFTSQTVTTRNFIGCAAQNYLSDADIISNNNFQSEAIQQICGDAFSTPNAAVNILSAALQKNAELHPNNHMVILSFTVSVTENKDDDVSNGVATQNFKACASVINNV